MTSEHDRRLAALRARLRDGGLAAAVLASPEAIYYLTGFDHMGYFAFTALVIPPGELRAPAVRRRRGAGGRAGQGAGRGRPGGLRGGHRPPSSS